MIIKHMKSDPNCVEHARLALLGCVLLLGPLLLIIGLVVGTFIELAQRVQRYGRIQNTVAESLLDIAGTSLWFWFYWKRMYK